MTKRGGGGDVTYLVEYGIVDDNAGYVVCTRDMIITSGVYATCQRRWYEVCSLLCFVCFVLR